MSIDLYRARLILTKLNVSDTERQLLENGHYINYRLTITLTCGLARLERIARTDDHYFEKKIHAFPRENISS